MSADNWTICPKCWDRAIKKNEQAKERVISCYGKVPQDEYVKILKEANAPVEMDNSLREDYEIGIDKEGYFGISYDAVCDCCDYRYSFTKNERIYQP